MINGVWVRITQQTAEGAAERSVPDSLKVGKSGKKTLGCQLVALSHSPQRFSLGVRPKQQEAEQKGRGFHAGAFHPSQISPCPCSSGCREHRWKLSQWKKSPGLAGAADVVCWRVDFVNFSEPEPGWILPDASDQTQG